MNWLPLAIFTPLLFAVYQAISKILPKGAPIFLVNAYVSLVGLVIMLSLHFVFDNDKSVALNNKSLWIALIIGVLISFGNFGIIKAYSLGAPQSLFTPVYYVSLIIYGVLIGILVFREKLNPLQLVGILLVLAGLTMTAYFRRPA